MKILKVTLSNALSGTLDDREAPEAQDAGEGSALVWAAGASATSAVA